MKIPSYWFLVLVAALGYFVDIYDLLLFSIVRVGSLKDIGVPENELLSQGVFLINMQMLGLLLGGVLWGVLGDKRGRLSVLFGSILLYSLANLANAYVQSVPGYAAFRFLAGIGLAGELGAGIILVCETLPVEARSFGTVFVATVGIFGAVVAALVGDYFPWRTAYIVGGSMGLVLLLLRMSVAESRLFEEVHKNKIPAGNFFSLFRSLPSLRRYLSVILVGIPMWFMIGVFITFSPEFGKAFGMAVLPSAGKAVMYCYLGLALGDFGSGFLSQFFQSRKKVVALYLFCLAVSIALYFSFAGKSLAFYYFFCFLMGSSAGYWAIFVTVAAEQFGTNLRSTVTTTVPNFVRGCVIPITILFQYLKVSQGIFPSAAIVAAFCLVLAIIALLALPETFGRDLSFVEP